MKNEIKKKLRQSLLGENFEASKWDSLEKDVNDAMIPLIEKYKGAFGHDSYAVIDAIQQVFDGMFQKVESIGEARGERSRRPEKQWKHGEKTVTNREMCADTYTLRRKVMDYIYRARDVIRNSGLNINFPRVTVRIVDITLGDAEDKQILGIGTMDDSVIIWIPASSICDRVNLQQLVYHELGHAVFNIGHINDPLMTQGKNSLSNSPETLDKWFLNLANIKK